MADQRRNAEGYMDMTAYEAIQNAEREMDMLPKKGEIWSFTNKDNIGSKCIIVHATNDYSVTLKLREREHGDSDVMVKVHGIPYYTNPALLGYYFNNGYMEKCQDMAEDDFTALLGAIADALCIKVDDQSDELLVCLNEIATLKDTIEELEEQLKKARMEVDRLTEQNFRLCKQSKENPTADVAALKAERDVYKTLYEQTIAKLIDGHKGA